MKKFKLPDFVKETNVTYTRNPEMQEVMINYYHKVSESELVNAVQKEMTDAISATCKKIAKDIFAKDIEPLIDNELRDIRITIKEKIIEKLRK